MSKRPRHFTYFVPEVPLEYVSDFAPTSNTTEARLLRLLLQSDAVPSTAPVVVVKGAGGTGKTTSLMGVGKHLNRLHKFTDAIWFASLGKDATALVLLEDLEAIVRIVLGEDQVSEIVLLTKTQSRVSAAVGVLNDYDVLLFLDDVWEDEDAHDVCQCTVFSLVQDLSRMLRRNPGRLRVVISTRDSRVAMMAPEQCRVLSQPFNSGHPFAREMLCRYAQVSNDEVRAGSAKMQRAFESVLNRCAGLHLALGVAGRAVLGIIESDVVPKEDAWCVYAHELAQMQAFLKTAHSDHPAIYAMLQSSLKHLSACLSRDSFVLPDELPIIFSFLGVMKKQEAVPLSMAECIWGLPEDETRRLCVVLERVHLVSLTNRDGTRTIRVHDIILEFCAVLLDERPRQKAYAHQLVVERVEEKILGRGSLQIDVLHELMSFSKVIESDVRLSLRNYYVRNIARHMSEAGGDNLQRLLILVSDYRWVKAHMIVSKEGNDVAGFVKDVSILVSKYGNDLDEEVGTGLLLISDAAQLSIGYVANNPRELAYQLEGRLRVHAGLNKVVDRFLCSLTKYAEKPRLKPGNGVLQVAGSPVVLKVSLKRRLLCIAVMPNGEDVVVGGCEGYLAVFSIRYASELHVLRGHRGEVRSLAVCNITNRIFSADQDGGIWAWKLGTEEVVGHPLLKHERWINCLVVTEDGKRLVVGNRHGCIAVCNSESGNILWCNRGHCSEVMSLSVGRQGRMIASGSWDGTVAFWDLYGREIRPRCSTGDRNEIRRIVLSEDLQRIAFVSWRKFGVIDVNSQKELRVSNFSGPVECSEMFAFDSEKIYVGTSDGRTAALLRKGGTIHEFKAHRDFVLGLVRIKGWIVSVSADCSLCVQSIERLNLRREDWERRFILDQFVVLPDRKRILCSWLKGPTGLNLLDIRNASQGFVLGEEGLMKASITIGDVDAEITAIAASPAAEDVLAFTSIGELRVYDSISWLPKYRDLNLQRMLGIVYSAAISNDGTYMAIGSCKGVVALFQLENGSEVRLPSSSELRGDVLRVTFSEDSSMLLALVRSSGSRDEGMLHIWKQIGESSEIHHAVLCFERLSARPAPDTLTMVRATTSHVVIRDVRDRTASVYDFSRQMCTFVDENIEDDRSGLLQHTRREHRDLEMKGALFLNPFGREIMYCSGTDNIVLGTLEENIYESFRPDHWVFDRDANVFIAGSTRSYMLTAVLVKEDEGPDTVDDAESQLPFVRPGVTVNVNMNPAGSPRTNFTVFISHAGPDKQNMALPLYRRLMARGIDTFVDKVQIRPGDVGVDTMTRAMQTADIGVFITSPEFACREWTLRELSCFLDRRRQAAGKAKRESKPGILPVFYRLGVHICRRQDLYETEGIGHLAIDEGFFSPERQKGMSTEKALKCIKGLASFAGIENERGVVNDADCKSGRTENQMYRKELLDKIVNAVVELQAKLNLNDVTGEGPDWRSGCEIA